MQQRKQHKRTESDWIMSSITHKQNNETEQKWNWQRNLNKTKAEPKISQYTSTSDLAWMLVLTDTERSYWQTESWRILTDTEKWDVLKIINQTKKALKLHSLAYNRSNT